MPLTIKVTSRTALNRTKFGELTLATADGLFALAVEIVENAEPNDAAPYGQGLVEGGGAVAWAGKKKVNSTTIGGRQVSKPRDLRLSSTQAVAIAGFGFPGRFHHNGTIDTPANPFLARSAAGVLPHAEVTLSKGMADRLARK